MKFDDRPEPAIRLEKARKKRGFATAKDAATFFGWSIHTYIQHENGTRGIGRAADRYAEAFHVSEAWLLTGEGRGPEGRVPVMGYVGAGAEVEPDFEQVPLEGLDQINVPFALPGDMVAFQVKGDSMLPQFSDGMVIIVFREQRRAIETFYGEQAIVRTDDGRRYVKTIERGAGGITLTSWNARPIENVQLVWIGEIFTFFPASAIRREATRTEKQGGLQGKLQFRKSA
jgi:phage repressor protein C with HTH and peptisase S24 domain